MLRGRAGLRTLAWVLLILFCLAFLRCDTTEKSMIRAILLEPGEQGWTVGLFYQAPEASADSSEAVAEVRFAAGEGDTLALALSEAEDALPQTANYRLCDYVLLAQSGGMEALEEYEALVLERQCGRTAAAVLACDFTCQELSEQSEESDGLPEKVLQCIKQTKPVSPCLYEQQQQPGLVLPWITLADEGAERGEGGYFLSGSGWESWPEQTMQAIWMLNGKNGVRRFWFENQALEVRRCVLSVTPQRDAMTLRLDCQAAFGAQAPDGAQADQLACLCAETVELLWSRGVDLAGLGGSAALKYGPDAAPHPTENACPQLRTDVQFAQIF